MRFFEILLILANLLVILFTQIPRLVVYARWTALLALGVALLQILIEQPRWQMIPLYGLTLVLLIISLRVKPLAWGWGTAGLLALALFCLPPVEFPVPVLPTLTGPYTVGTQTFEWIDLNRPETLSTQSSGPRRLMVQVWYPAAAAPGEQPGLYMNDYQEGGAAVARKFGFPAFMLSHLGLARTHAYPGAPFPSGNERYPVLVFSHGWQGLRMQNTYQMEELASYGYVVFAPDHTYGAAVTTFPDGTSILNRPELLPSGVTEAEYNQAARLLGQAWTGDLRFVLDQAEKLNSGQMPGIFNNRLDLTKVGFLGHSTGGGAAVEACFSDARCKAGLAMDAWMVPYAREISTTGLKVPFFFFQSENWPNGANAGLLPPLYQAMKAPAWRLTISGTKHYDFSDIGLLSPLTTAVGIKGPIDSMRALKMINAYSVAFFQYSLRGKASALLDAAAPQYPEIKFEKK